MATRVCVCVCECAVFAIHRRHFYKNFNPLMAAISAISILLTANLQYLHGAFAEGRSSSSSSSGMTMCVIKARHCNESFAYNPNGATLNECIQLGECAVLCGMRFLECNLIQLPRGKGSSKLKSQDWRRCCKLKLKRDSTAKIKHCPQSICLSVHLSVRLSVRHDMHI